MTPDNSTPFSDFLDDYFAECDDHLMGVRRLLLSLETSVGRAEINRTVLDGLFPGERIAIDGQLRTHRDRQVPDRADDGAGASPRAQRAERYFLEKPDLVLLDLVMKGMMGLDVLGKLHEMDPNVRSIVPADIQDSSREMAAAGGARIVLNKPIDRASLLSAVAGVLVAPG